MATLGTVGNLLGAALKGSVNASIDQYRERRAEAQGKVDWEEYNYPRGSTSCTTTSTTSRTPPRGSR